VKSLTLRDTDPILLGAKPRWIADSAFGIARLFLFQQRQQW